MPQYGIKNRIFDLLRRKFVVVNLGPYLLAAGRNYFTLLAESGLMQLLDDCGPKMTFAHADVYDGKNISVGKPNSRILNPVILPYRLTKSSRSYSLYEYSGA